MYLSPTPTLSLDNSFYLHLCLLWLQIRFFQTYSKLHVLASTQFGLYEDSSSLKIKLLKHTRAVSFLQFLGILPTTDEIIFYEEPLLDIEGKVALENGFPTR